ncbi:transmembrane protein, putative (macronuclear) [Tetrahymena thermophila SB210]|uniref:Transmembrane protein, putative n=1 Tax=Tetrahymena thermophila (strain SB210) TaxID=312017 RepID=Q23T98_TETTS|nr:transmembrane protein, putative [Tetrahymena thermophila SB210]EAR99808.2 transmembrane protein, putative [Tetrahymena thermophila SB210]|eukprot:XP_001020053.2 transmembrane protein, putative [Tetrahymena thermophila SB210]
MLKNGNILLQQVKKNLGDQIFEEQEDDKEMIFSLKNESKTIDQESKKLEKADNLDQNNNILSNNDNKQDIHIDINQNKSSFIIDNYNQEENEGQMEQAYLQKKNTLVLNVVMPKVEVFQKVEINLEEQGKNNSVNVEECKEKLKFMHMCHQLENKQLVPYTTCQSLCSTYVGFSCCFIISKKKSDLDQQGIAITAINSNMTKLESYSSYLAYTFVGTWGYDVWSCLMGNYQDLKQLKDNYIICQTGTLDVNFYRVGLVQPSNSTNYYGCQFTQFENIIPKCNSDPYQYLSEKCQNQPQCNIDYNEFIQTAFQKTDECTEMLKTFQIFISLPCRNSYMNIGSLQISKFSLSIFIVMVDTVIFFIFLIAVYSMKKSNKKISDQITINNCMAENFTILIKNLPDIQQDQLVSKLWEHLQNYLDYKSKQKNQDQIKIIDIKLGLKFTQIKYQKKICKLSKHIEKHIFKFVKKYDKENCKLKFEQNVTINHLRAIYELIEDLKLKSKANIDLQKIIKLKADIQELKMKDFDMSQQKNGINFAWVTFETMDQKQRAFRFLSRSIITVYFYKIYYAIRNLFSKNQDFNSHKIHFCQKVLVIEKTVTPDSINWKNLYYSFTNRFFRQLFSFIVSIIILVGSFVAIGIIKSLPKFLTIQYPSVNCNTSQFQAITKEDIEHISQDTSDYDRLVLIECFCWLKNYQYHLQSSLYSICNDWYQNYLSKLFLPIGIVIVLFIVNFVIQKILSKLSKFEKEKFLNNQMNSTINKIFLVSFINTALIVFLTNMNYNSNNSNTNYDNFMQKVFASGQYYAFNPEWYRNVGIIFSISLLSKALSNPLGKIFFYYYKRVVYFFDQSCTCDQNKTKCKNNKEWLKLRQGPKFNIQYRYAQHLVVLFFMMTFGNGMPLIYFASLFYFIFSFYSDKFLVGLDLAINFSNPFLAPISIGSAAIVFIYTLKITLKPLEIYKVFCKKRNSESEKKSIIKLNKFYEFMVKEQIQTEIQLIEYSFYYNQPDTYLKQRLIEKKDILQNYLNQIDQHPPLLTFLGNYSYDYKINETFQGKLRWEKDLKIWKLEQTQSLIQLINSSDYKKDSSLQTKSNQNNNAAGSQESQNKQFIKQQTFSRWQNNDIKKQETQDIQFYNKSLKTQYTSMRKTLKSSKTDKLILRSTFNQTLQNTTKIENLSVPIHSKNELSAFQTNDNLNHIKESNQIIVSSPVSKEIFQFQGEKGYQGVNSQNKQNPFLKFSQQYDDIVLYNVLPNQEELKIETDLQTISEKENRQIIHISKEVLSEIKSVDNYQEQSKFLFDVDSIDGKIQRLPSQVLSIKL